MTDSAFDARNFALNGVPTAKPQSESNRYGINIGGPLMIPHVFDLSKKFNFTVNYNGTIANTAATTFPTCPRRRNSRATFRA